MECVFCQIFSGKIPSFKIWEDKDHLAFLDINPNVEGQTLVISKKHFPSNIFNLPKKDYSKFLIAVKKVALILEKALETKRVAMIFEGLGINHTHLKLYPLQGLKEEFGAGEAPERTYFKKYPGFVSSQLGPPADPKKLNLLAKKIKRFSDN